MEVSHIPLSVPLSAVHFRAMNRPDSLGPMAKTNEKNLVVRPHDISILSIYELVGKVVQLPLTHANAHWKHSLNFMRLCSEYSWSNRLP